MSATMSRCNFSERYDVEIVDDAVSRISNRGISRQVAAKEAAQWLGTNVRRIQSFLFGEPVRVDADELAELRANYIRLLDDDARDLERRAAATRARIQELRGALDADTSKTPIEILEGGKPGFYPRRGNHDGRRKMVPV